MSNFALFVILKMSILANFGWFWTNIAFYVFFLIKAKTHSKYITKAHLQFAWVLLLDIEQYSQKLQFLPIFGQIQQFNNSINFQPFSAKFG